MNFSTIPKQMDSRIAGVLYLLIAIFSGFSMGYLPNLIIATGDAVTTAQNLQTYSGIFRVGFAADILVILLEIMLTVILYFILKKVHPKIALMALLSRFAMAVIMGVNLLNYLIPMALLDNPTYLEVFHSDQLQALALLFLEAHQFVVLIWGLFFGIHLALLGFLVFKSGFYPKILGILLIIGSFGYTTESIGKFTLPGNEIFEMLAMVLLGFAVIGELSFAFWLLIKGAKQAV
ncbi:DUF4386 domain-containing protein [Flexithrix dorotheae]|uniref:DUF4386 domain-containing protein n=1 Tax=Flexithrix dorotheae TaxID=70993 RepID=UPI00037F80C5|nr:DUF4386 domain-containing protein [Flexithrix dorotheae]